MSGLKHTNKLHGHRVLVIGGSSGIGFSVAEAALEHGANVILSSSSQKKLDAAAARLRDHGKANHLTSVDVSTKTCNLLDLQTLDEEIKGLLEFATQGGKLDHVIYTAGDKFNQTPHAEVTVDIFYATAMLRNTAVVIITKYLPQYINSDIRSSLTLTSGTNGWRPFPNWGLVSGICSFTEGYARGLAVDMKPVRVNCISPGAVFTEFLQATPKEQLDGFLGQLKAQALTGTVARPDEVAEAYVLSMKSTFITGQTIHADGGRLVGDSR
jgi:NAD(P)-dependent dehydrogenase (short-subunit alcohol dehydrogenase family)